MIALAAHDLTCRFPGASVAAVRGVSLDFPAGRIVAIVGPSGSGKSTLLACLAGLTTPASGRVVLAGGGAPRPGDVGLVFQNPLHQVVASSVERELAFSLEVRSVSRADMRPRVARAIHALGFDGRETTPPSQLSAGECQRLLLHAVLIAESPVVLLDEPTTMLDPSGRLAVLEEIRRVAGSGCAVGFVTQFPDEALIADHVVAMENGAIASAGAPRDVVGFDPSRPPGSNAPLTSAARLARDMAHAGASLGRSVLTIDDLSGALGNGVAAPRVGEATKQRPSSEVLDLRDVRLGSAPFEGRFLRGITLAVRRGEATILVGPTGSGKTTALLIAAGALPVDGGSRILAPGVVHATVLQYPERHFTEGSVRDEIIAVGAAPSSDHARETLRALGVDPGLDARSPFELSVGEQRRLALALQMMRRPDLLIADEPTAGLDPESAGRVGTALLEWMRAGGALLIATHDEDLADSLGGTAHVMGGGEIGWSGPVASLWAEGTPPSIRPPAWRALARIRASDPGPGSRADLIRRVAEGEVRNA